MTTIFSRNVPVAVLAVLVVWFTGSDVAESADDAKLSIYEVVKTYNDSPFEYRMRPVRKTGAYSVYRFEYPSPVNSSHESNNTIPADYYLPNGIKRGASAGGDLPAHSQRQLRVGEYALFVAGRAGNSGHNVQASLLR